MKKIERFLLTIHHWQHIFIGLVVGFAGGGFLRGCYESVLVASVMEAKDKQAGNMWDWTDWLCTSVAGVLASALWLLKE